MTGAVVAGIGRLLYCDALRRFTRYMTARGWARSPWAVGQAVIRILLVNRLRGAAG